MNEHESRQLLIDNLLDIYRKCGMDAIQYKRNVSFFQKIFGSKDSTDYPDICIRNFRGDKGKCAYYYVRKKGDAPNININSLPAEIKSSWVKIIFGSVFCLEEQTPDIYMKGKNYAAQYKSQAVLPLQNNIALPRMLSDKELAQILASSYQNLDNSIVAPYLDKDMHYDNDSIFDDMASREEYIYYIDCKFKMWKENHSIKKVQLGRMGENGKWSVLIKQVDKYGIPTVVALITDSAYGRITNISIRLMDLPDF